MIWPWLYLAVGFGAAHPQWATLAAVVVALLLGHFLWHGSGAADAELRRMRE